MQLALRWHMVIRKARTRFTYELFLRLIVKVKQKMIVKVKQKMIVKVKRKNEQGGNYKAQIQNGSAGSPS